MTAPVFPVMTVPVKPCGCLDGDFCTCACDAAKDRIELAAAFAAPILLPPHGPWASDPALDVRRPCPDMVDAMCPPLRWSLAGGAVSVSLGVNP